MKNRIKSLLSAAVAMVIFGTMMQAQPSSQRIVRDFEHNAGLENVHLHDKTVLDVNAAKRGLAIVSQKLSRGVIVFQENVQLSNEAPFVMCGITLKLDNANAENVRVFVRARQESASNTEVSMPESAWQLLPFDTHTEDETEGITPEEAFGALVGHLTLRTHVATLPATTRSVEVKIELQRSATRIAPVIRHYQCLLHNPGKTSAEELARMREALTVFSRTEKNSVTLQNSRIPRPVFLTRTQWGCPWGQTSGPNTLTPTVPTHLIVHHSFSPGNDITDWAAAVRGVWNFHVNSNGWSDIGYNWLIDPQGVIYQGRAWIDSMDNAQGAHFCGFNRATMGVCMLGDFNSITPTEAAQRSLVRLLAYRASVNALDPRAISFHANSNRTLNNISGHRDGCATDCPGNMQYPLLATYRNRVFAYMNPPVIAPPTATVESAQSATVSAFVRPNGSATQVFVEWGSALSSLMPPQNRRLVRQFTAQDTATTVTATLTGLQPNSPFIYRFVAQNSDTSAQSVFGILTTPASTGSALQNSADRIMLSVSPNPSQGEMQFRFTVAATSHVRILIRDVRGIVVGQPLQQTLASGEYNITFREDNLASGIYYCYLELVNGQQTQFATKMISIFR